MKPKMRTYSVLVTAQARIDIEATDEKEALEIAKENALDEADWKEIKADKESIQLIREGETVNEKVSRRLGIPVERVTAALEELIQPWKQHPICRDCWSRLGSRFDEVHGLGKPKLEVCCFCLRESKIIVFVTLKDSLKELCKKGGSQRNSTQ